MRPLKILIICILFISSIHLIAKESDSEAALSKGALFTGLVKGGEPGKDSLFVQYVKDLIVDFHPTYKQFYVQPGKNGAFSFHLPKVNGIGRVYLKLMGSHSTYLCPDYMSYYVKNNDSIFLNVYIDKDGEVKPSFSGKGADKYLAAQSIFSVPFVEDYFPKFYYKEVDKGKEHLAKIIKRNELRFELMRYTLDYFKNRLDPDIYQLFEADILGKAYGALEAHTELYQRFENYDVLDKPFLNNLKVANHLDEKIMVSSQSYMKYIMRKTLLAFQIKNHRKGFSLSEIYEWLKTRPTGLLRDKLITTYLYVQHYRYWEEYYSNRVLKQKPRRQEDLTYEDVVWDALQNQIQDPSLKEILNRSFDRYKIGAKAYNFALPDINGNIVKLSDFKGKVMLVDVYGPGCTGCVLFAKKLKETVIPEFKNNPQVVFVAISMEDEKEKWLKDLEESDRNANKAYQVCLWTEGLGTKHPFLQYYDFQLAPLLLLIDKEGKLYNSSNDGLVLSLSGEEIIAMISEALGENNDW